MLRPALPWARGSRVPVSASGLKPVWFRRLHHPRRRCAPCLVPRRQAASNRGTSQTLTSQGKRVLLVPARASHPPDSSLVADGQGPPFSPDHNSSHDLDPSLKLRILGSEEKGIRGGDAELHFQSASRPGNLLVGRRSRHLFGSPRDSRSAGSPVPLTTRRCALLVALTASLRSLPSDAPSGASLGAFRRCRSFASRPYGHRRLTTLLRGVDPRRAMVRRCSWRWPTRSAE